MKSTVGRPRRTTDAQVEIILTWHAQYMAWKALKPASIRELARSLGISAGTVSGVIRQRGEYKQPSPEGRVAEQERRRARLRRSR